MPVPDPKWGADAGIASVGPVLFHPDYTVGSGITPDLLTLACARRSRAWRCRLTAGGESHPALRTLRHMGAAGFDIGEPDRLGKQTQACDRPPRHAGQAKAPDGQRPPVRAGWTNPEAAIAPE